MVCNYLSPSLCVQSSIVIYTTLLYSHLLQMSPLKRGDFCPDIPGFHVTQGLFAWVLSRRCVSGSDRCGNVLLTNALLTLEMKVEWGFIVTFLTPSLTPPDLYELATFSMPGDIGKTAVLNVRATPRTFLRRRYLSTVET